MSCCVIFGGAGFVGTHLAKHLLRTGRFTHVHIADIRKTSLEKMSGVTVSITDVRRPIPIGLVPKRPEWIFNLAAVHREPGHMPYEYYETNVAGARHCCEYADIIGCDNIYFTSSISVYGPTLSPTDEESPVRPATPYGGSKYSAEMIHEIWHRAKRGRRLLISRPGVLYGPGDKGNILRLVNAIRKRCFAFPGSPHVYKSYGYIYGLLESIDFSIDSDLGFLRYNYVETPTQPLIELTNIIKQYLGIRALILPVPLWILLPIAKAVHMVFGDKNPIHPTRVKKAAMSTHIIPKALMEHGFRFTYDFAGSLVHWKMLAPEDFGLADHREYEQDSAALKLRRSPETDVFSARGNDRARAKVKEKVAD